MRLGIATSIPWLPDTSQQDCFNDALAEVQLAEDLGFDCVWFTEHHFARHGLNSGLTAWLAAVAMKTSRIRIGSTVFVLPFWDPIRLAEDVAMVDILSNGRVEFGVGTGYRLDEFAGFGVDPEIARVKGRECFDLVMELWKGEPVTFKGKYHELNEVAIRPVPLQQPHPPVWWPGQSPGTLEYIAKNGFNWMSATTLGTTATIIERRETMVALLEAEGRSIDDLGIYIHVPTLVANKTYDEIRESAEPGIQFLRNSAMWYTARATPGAGTIYGKPGGLMAPFEFKSFYENEAFFGDPETCFQKIEGLYKALRPTDLTFLFKQGQSREEVFASMQLFAEEVMPRVRELEATPVSG